MAKKKKSEPRQVTFYSLGNVIEYLEENTDDSHEMSLAIAVLNELEQNGEVTTEENIELEDCVLAFDNEDTQDEEE
jgi:hypothetical protein